MPSMVLGSNPKPFDFRAFSFGGLFLKQDQRSNNISYIIMYLIRYMFNVYIRICYHCNTFFAAINVTSFFCLDSGMQSSR